MLLRDGRIDLTPAQCRMARAGLQLGVRELAEAAKVSTNTITRFEGGQPLLERTMGTVQRALEIAGAEFISETVDGGDGVRLKKTAALAGQIDDVKTRLNETNTAPERTPEHGMEMLDRGLDETKLRALRAKQQRPGPIKKP